MKFCYNCGTQIGEGDKFCQVCGSKLEQAYSKAADQQGTEQNSDADQPDQIISADDHYPDQDKQVNDHNYNQLQHSQQQFNQPQYSQQQHSQPQYNQAQYSQQQYSSMGQPVQLQQYNGMQLGGIINNGHINNTLNTDKHPSAKNKKKGSKTIVWVMLAVLIIAAGVGIFLFLRKNKNLDNINDGKTYTKDDESGKTNQANEKTTNNDEKTTELTEKNTEYDNTTENSSEKSLSYDTGVIKVSIPEGWLAIDVHDIWSDDPNAIDPDQLQIAKGATSKDDLWGCCYLQINYSGPGTIMASAKDYYDNVVDIAPFEAAGYSWTGYECESMGYKYTIIEGKKGEEQLQVAVLKNSGDKTINFEDEDVQFIINSIETTIPADTEK